MNATIISSVITIGITVGFVFLGKSTDMLKDDSAAQKKPYSFARVQMAWWTVIVAGSYLYIIMNRIGWADNIDASATCSIINNSTLILLGIGVSTTAAGRIIDNSQSNGDRHQDEESEGLILDIISDANGVSIHRLQSLIFTFTFGVMFIVKVYNGVHGATSCVVMPDFSTTELTLMGLSSATYAALKVGENSNSDPVQG